MILKIAELKDIEAILKLHGKYQLDSIQDEDKKDGFVTTAFTKKQLSDITYIQLISATHLQNYATIFLETSFIKTS